MLRSMSRAGGLHAHTAPHYRRSGKIGTNASAAVLSSVASRRMRSRATWDAPSAETLTLYRRPPSFAAQMSCSSSNAGPTGCSAKSASALAVLEDAVGRSSRCWTAALVRNSRRDGCVKSWVTNSAQIFSCWHQSAGRQTGSSAAHVRTARGSTTAVSPWSTFILPRQ
jgi:hypothetical protein